MKAYHHAESSFGGLIDFTGSVNENGEGNNPLQAGWLSLRKQQMDIGHNCIFPGRDRGSFLRKYASLKPIVLFMFKILVKI